MKRFESNRPKRPMLDDAPRAEEDLRSTATLPVMALRTLDRIAEALGVTTALLHQPTPSELPCDGPVSLMEASTLVQAFIRIDDPAARRRCLAFVQAAAREDGDG